MMTKIQNALILWESFDTKGIVEEAKRQSPDTAFWAIRRDWLLYPLESPPGMRLPRLRAWFYSSWRGLFYALYPFYLLQSILGVFAYFMWLRLARRIRIANLVTINPYHGMGLALMRRLGLIDHLVFIAGDWFASALDPRGIWSRFGQQMFHPWCDRWMVSSADCTYNVSEGIAAARDRFWGRKVAKRERLMEPSLEWLGGEMTDVDARHAWLFMGTLRIDSGLDLLLDALSREPASTRLRLIGGASPERGRFVALASERGLGDRLDLHGFVDRKDLPALTRDCLFGVNLITRGDSYTAHTIPAKIMDYLQLGLPVICTEHVGFMAGHIREQEMGFVCPPTSEGVRWAIRRVREDFTRIHGQIRKYVLERKPTRIFSELD